MRQAVLQAQRATTPPIQADDNSSDDGFAHENVMRSLQLAETGRSFVRGVKQGTVRYCGTIRHCAAPETLCLTRARFGYSTCLRSRCNTSTNLKRPMTMKIQYFCRLTLGRQVKDFFVDQCHKHSGGTEPQVGSEFKDGARYTLFDFPSEMGRKSVRWRTDEMGDMREEKLVLRRSVVQAHTRRHIVTLMEYCRLGISVRCRKQAGPEVLRKSGSLSNRPMDGPLSVKQRWRRNLFILPP
ncbi:hypothetical protein RRG08_062206 [Elysia crispata]|uniref:Uncharacterized protein n=1 Tax=Elysia crispata TaxID=231223 RepID=A0AAE0Y979_9GAST|nr:hypothetical protein RRG08_062206 [Elysia crispata]